VIQEVQNPNMNLRMYAIRFLANEKNPHALPALRNILKDNLQADYSRSEALLSICNIDYTEGMAYAGQYANDNGILGETACSLLKYGDRRLYRRTSWEAQIRDHE